MITLRRAGERRQERPGKRQAFLTFHSADRAHALAGGFGTLESLAERRLSPAAAVPGHPRRDAEIITYVREGALAYEDSTGGSGVLYAGEFQRITSKRGFRNDEINASRSDSAHIFHIVLAASAGLEIGREQKRFSSAERRGRLCIVASPDARKGSLCIHQDALVHSALLDRGQHVVHELPPGRGAWLHVVEGAVTLGEVVLTTGDGAGVTGEWSVSVTAQDESEVLLLEVSRARP